MSDLLERARDYTVTMGDHWKNGEVHDLVCDLAAEVRALRADVVWAVRNAAEWFDDSVIVWQTGGSRLGEASFDGTDADILRAVREARER